MATDPKTRILKFRSPAVKTIRFASAFMSSSRLIVSWWLANAFTVYPLVRGRRLSTLGFCIQPRLVGTMEAYWFVLAGGELVSLHFWSFEYDDNSPKDSFGVFASWVEAHGSSPFVEATGLMDVAVQRDEGLVFVD